jgi:hypothetical protein
MPDRRFPSTQAAASHTLAALERYQAQVRRLAGDWMDMELYGVVGRHVEDVRQGCLHIQPLSRPWVELLIAHAELVQALWQSSRPGSGVDAAARQRQLSKVMDAVQGLQHACMQLPGS